MADFLLLHGAWHSARSWWKLIPELEKRGHRATAIDLPGQDPDATTASFVAVIDAAVADPEQTVLVAHSAAGLWAPIVAERRPVRELVLLAALLPNPGFSWIEQLADEPLQPEFAAAQYRVLTRGADEGGSVWSAEEAAQFFYNDIDPSELAEAVSYMRPESASVAYQEKTPLAGRLRTPARYVRCAKDRAVSHEWVSKVASDRFDAHIVEFDASHAPFASRPAALAELLVQGH